jgi:Ca2+-binding EF-hand superfamily protein
MRTLTNVSLGIAICLLCACGVARTAGHQQLARMLDQIGDADTNKDGRITRQEWTAFRSARFERADRNHDGQLSADDVPARMRGRGRAGQLEQVIADSDQNGDGRLSRDEFVSGTRLFDWLDKDRDGSIDAEESKRARELKK